MGRISPSICEIELGTSIGFCTEIAIILLLMQHGQQIQDTTKEDWKSAVFNGDGSPEGHHVLAGLPVFTICARHRVNCVIGNRNIDVPNLISLHGNLVHEQIGCKICNLHQLFLVELGYGECRRNCMNWLLKHAIGTGLKQGKGLYSRAA